MMIYTPSDLNRKINDAIEQISFDRSPRSLYTPIEYILSLGGKRLRPVLAYMATNLFSDDVDNATNAAIGLEVFHNFSLLHDDLMDNASVRRGAKTVHIKWDANTAILSGDAMLIEAYNHIMKAGSNEVLSIFNTTAMQVCEGQQYDMDFETRLDVTTAEYLEMIRLKTAVLIAASLQIGAIMGGASKKNAEKLYEFGINIGLAFQLKDDLLDVYGDPKEFGKNIGGDIVCNKKTFLLIKALENSQEEQHAVLNKWLSAETFDPEMKIKAVKEIYDDLNLDNLAEKLIQKYYLAGLACLSEVDVSAERKQQLLDYTNQLMKREK